MTQAFGGNNQSGPIDVATARNACASASGRLDFETETFLVTAADTGVHYAYYSHDYANDRITAVSGVNPALTASNTASGNLNVAVPVIGFHANAQADQLPSETRDTSVSDPLTCSQSAAVALAHKVRRLTPIECERLQGFPDGHTQIPWRNKPADQCPDGPRYKALGNSMAVPVMRWLGQKIDVALLFQE